VLFLYGPVITIFVLSFQGPDGGLTFPMQGMSTHWYGELWKGLGVVDIGAALRRSFALGAVVMALTVLLSLSAGLAFRKKLAVGDRHRHVRLHAELGRDRALVAGDRRPQHAPARIAGPHDHRDDAGDLCARHGDDRRVAGRRRARAGQRGVAAPPPCGAALTVLPMRLLVINPNTTAAVTKVLQRRIASIAGDAVQVDAITARFGSAYIAD